METLSPHFHEHYDINRYGRQQQNDVDVCRKVLVGRFRVDRLYKLSLCHSSIFRFRQTFPAPWRNKDVPRFPGKICGAFRRDSPRSNQDANDKLADAYVADTAKKIESWKPHSKLRKHQDVPESSVDPEIIR